MDESKKRLDEEISKELENLKTLEPGTEEHSAAVESLSTLYKLKIEEDKAKQDADNKNKMSGLDIVRVVIDAGGIIVPAVIYSVWMKRGFEFEKEGTYTSTTFRGLFNKFKPTRK